MSVKTEVTKVKNKVTKISENAKANFDKLETDTRSALEEALNGYDAIWDGAQKEIDKSEAAIQDYFKSKEFLTLDADQIQFDAEVRAELKYHLQHTPTEGFDCVAINQVRWNSRTAAAALRQDPEKHLTVSPIAKTDQRRLQEIVLNNAGGEAAKLLPKLEALEADKSMVDIEMRRFKDRNEFYSIVLKG